MWDGRYVRPRIQDQVAVRRAATAGTTWMTKRAAAAAVGIGSAADGAASTRVIGGMDVGCVTAVPPFLRAS